MRKIATYFSIWALLVAPLSVYAGNKKAEKIEEQEIFVSTIQMIATAYASIKALTSCPSQPSVLIFGMGGIAYVFGEIKNWKNYKESSDVIAKEYRTLDPEKVEKQIIVFDQAEKETREAENAARERAGNAETAATTFTIAAIIALIEFILSFPPMNYEDGCQSSSSGYFKNIFNNLIPKAHAEVQNAEIMGITSVAAVALLATYQESIGELMDQVLSEGWTRAIGFGAFAAHAFYVQSLNEDAADEYKKQADEYARLKQKLISQLGKTRFTKYNEIQLGLNEAIQIQQNQDKPKNCATGSTGQANLDPDCDCLKNNSCKSISLPNPDFRDFTLPGSITAGMQSFGTMANQSYSGNTSGANLSQDQLNSNNGAIRKFKRDFQDAVNKSLSKKGKSPIDFKEQEDLYRKEIMKRARASLSPQSLASLKNSFGVSPKVGSSNEAKSKDEDKVKFIKPPRNLSINLPKRSKGKRKKTGDPLSDFLLIADGENQEALDTGAALSQFKTKEEDINKNKKESIFKIISIRYLKTAYPVFFEKEE